MCAICGRYNVDGRPVVPQQIVAMRDVMAHRGPDGQGLFVEGGVGLGHRRLSIIDLATGHQPVTNEDKTVTVVFNGEIYNYRELRQELCARNHVFTTHSDTETIVHLYEELGPACVERLRGMFAFAIWDARRRRLLLARDRLGIKPLYYACPANSIVFGSEIKSVLSAADVPAEPDPRGLRRYLTYRHPYGDGTMFKDVRQLPPGHVLVADASGTTVTRYWDVPEGSAPARDGDSRDRFLSLLEESVRLRMISDVPLGSFLSGGLDSSAVTSLMARHSDRVRTFSIGFVPGEENELSWARVVADRVHAEHHEYVLGSEDFFTLMGRLVWHQDEPMMFPASIPLYLLSRESKQNATVMLAGEGADELMAGYSGNVRGYWMRRARGYLPSAALALAGRLPRGNRVRSAAAQLALDDTDSILAAFRISGSRRAAAACRLPLPAHEADDAALLDEVGFTRRRRGTYLDGLLYFQLKTYLVALLMKQDKMSMAASIETRVPFLDHHLVEFVWPLADDQKIRGGRGKDLLRRAARGLVPDEIIDRPKQGFPVPIARWLRQPKNPFIDVLLDPGTLRDGFLEARYVRERVDRFLAGQAPAMELWSLLNLELWRRAFIPIGARVSAVAS
jgi:asparagine synthase (glutamine-hydrolysing)